MDVMNDDLELETVIENTVENEFVHTSEELVTGDRFLNLYVLESFLEKHPEDVFKWKTHLEIRNHKEIVETATEEVINKHIIQHEANDPDTNEPFCKLCKKTFVSTESHPTLTLLCNHKYHTICYLMYQNTYDKSCPETNCEINMWYIARKMNEKVFKQTNDVAKMMVNKFKKNKDFNKSITELKGYIRTMGGYRSKLAGERKQLRKELFEKHGYFLQSIQNDLNSITKKTKESENYKLCKSWISKYRKLETTFLRKYNLTLRELIKYKFIKINWQDRRVLEYNGRLFSRYSSRICINEGSKKWI